MMDADMTPRATAQSDAIERRVRAATAVRSDPAAARSLLADPLPKVRAAAISALVRLGAARESEVDQAISDPDPLVRRRVCELANRLPHTDFSPLLDDPADSVVEAAAYALGETGATGTTDRLARVAREHPDALCREAAVAALGAIGAPSGKAAILSALDDVPAVRRRAIVALAAFDGPDVDTALRTHLSDRDWQTRQAAAAILGVSENEPR